MTPARDAEHCDMTEPLHPAHLHYQHHHHPHQQHDDDTTADADTRVRDDLPVLACENGVCTAVQPLPSKSSQYLKTLRWPKGSGKRKWPRWPGCSLRCRELLVLSVGVLLATVALAVIVTGVFRTDDNGGTATSAFLRINSLINRVPSDSDSTEHKSLTDKLFTFEQLLYLNNYALNKPTHQSSVFLEILDIPELDGEADFAVDGSVSTCARTEIEHDPFWYLDMGQIEHIRSVRLYGSDANRLHDLDVYVGNSENVTENALCTRIHSDSAEIDVRIVCDDNRVGRYFGLVMRTRPERPESLIICEALVYLM